MICILCTFPSIVCDKVDHHFFSEAPRTTVIDTAKIKAPAGQGCPRCGGVVYAAEQMLAKGRVSTELWWLI
jgi:hypothetical protein